MTVLSVLTALALGLSSGLVWADDAAPAAAAGPDQLSPSYHVPLTFRSETKSCDARVTLPPEASVNAKVLGAVSADAAGWLWDLTAEAADAERRSGKEPWWRPYSGALAFKPAFVSDRVVSLLGEWWRDTGGAHPNSGFLAENIDPKTGAAVEWTGLFPASARGAAMPPAVLQYVHDDLVRQKRKRLGGGFDAKMAEDFMQDLGKDAPIFTFAKSKASGRAGGLTLHFPPYAVGAYVEGAYTVGLPLSVFASQLAPGWRDAFAPPPKR